MVSENARNMSLLDNENTNLSFAGCGFLGIYHVGVASCLREYAPHLIAHEVAGASAGALVAAAMITDCCLGDATSYTLRIAAKARQRALGPLHPSFNVVKYLREGLDTFLPDNAHVIANGRLHISLTRLSDRRNVVVNQFDTKDELIQALICSSFIPFYCGILPPKYRGVRYVDGGLSVNIPILNDNTLTVSPFAGESDICPTDSSATDMHIHLVNTSIQFTMTNLYRASYAFFPPHPEILAEMCKQGFDDALRFLQKNTLINCTRHISINSRIMTEGSVRTGEVAMSTSSEETGEDFSSSSDEDEQDGHVELQSKDKTEIPSHLPPSVLTALQAAIDSVNKGVLAPIYNAKTFKVLALMAAPWILPLDVAFVLTQRLIEWVPYMPSDMQWFVKELAAVIGEIIQFIKHGRHNYSARFTCQLAITEVDYHQMAPKRGLAPVGSASPFVQRRTTIKAAERHYRNHSHNVGFGKEHGSRFNAPLKQVDDLRQQILKHKDCNYFRIRQLKVQEDEHFSDADDEESGSEKAGSGHAHRAQSPAPHRKSIDDPCINAYDQFENCLEVADDMDSVLAFYYMEENNPGVVKVTEIFALDEQHGPLTCRSRAGSEPVDAKMFSHSEMKQEKDELNLQKRKLKHGISTDSVFKRVSRIDTPVQ